KGRLVGPTIGFSTTTAASSSASTQIAASTLTNEYIFLQCAWEVTTAGTNSGADRLFRLGPLTDLTNGSFLVTAPFAPIVSGGGAVTSPIYFKQTWLEACCWRSLSHSPN